MSDAPKLFIPPSAAPPPPAAPQPADKPPTFQIGTNTQKTACPLSWLLGMQQESVPIQVRTEKGSKIIEQVMTKQVPFNMTCVGADCSWWSEIHGMCVVKAAGLAFATGRPTPTVAPAPAPAKEAA